MYDSFGIGTVGKAYGSPPSKVDNSKIMASVPAWTSGQKMFYPSNYKELLLAYRSWVYICANKNGNSFASVPLKLYVTKSSKSQKIFVQTKSVAKEKLDYMMSLASISDLPCVRKAVEIEEVTDHVVLDTLWQVNPFMDKFELLFLTDIFLELCGNAYWYIVRNTFGVPVEIWMLSPDRVQIVPSKEKWIQGYVFTALDGREIPFMPDEIIHFRFPNPNNVYYGWAPLEAVFSAYGINQQMNQYQSNLMRNNAIPSIALIAPKDAVIGETQWKQILTRWNQTYGGVRNVGKTAWLESGFDIKTLAASPKDMAYPVQYRQVMQEICAAYGVPLSKVTVDNVNRSNAESGDYQYLADTIRPRCTLFQERLNQDLLPMVDANLFFSYDNPVPSDKEYEMKERESNLKSYVTTINEERKKMGLPEVEWGDVPLTTQGVAPLGSAPPQLAPNPQLPTEEKIMDEIANIIFMEVEKKKRMIA